MQKQAPSIGRILVAVGFTLSCFGLLLFLWVTFGGPVPFKPESYRFTADFPEAITLQKEAGRPHRRRLDRQGQADRSAARERMPFEPRGVQHDPRNDRDLSSIRADLLRREGDPPPEDAARGDLRRDHHGSQVQPGQTSGNVSAQSSSVDVGQLSGSDAPQPIPEGCHLAQTQVQDQTQIDEIFQGFDKPTREAFQSWMQNAGLAINGRGLDLNDAFGNLGPFASDASDVLGTLRSQEQSHAHPSSTTRGTSSRR